MSNYILFLDDEREPSYGLLKDHSDIEVCRTYGQAVEVVLERGLPQHIHFDHDLGPDSKNGHEFAKFLVDWLIDKADGDGYPIIGYSVHSQNPIGADNIRGTIDGYHRYAATMVEI